LVRTRTASGTTEEAIVLTLQQVIDYLHAHGAPAYLVRQVVDLSSHHRLNAATFQDLSTRLRWRPRGVSWNDAMNWARSHHR
jgi:hypothetical protein